MGKKFTSDSPSLAEIRRRKKPNRVSCQIPLDPEISRQISEKERELERERNRVKRNVGKSLAEANPTTKLEEELEALWDQAEGAIATFWFQDCGRKKYDDLVTEHPPTKEQRDEWKEGGGEGNLAYDPNTFVPALIALTAVDPVISLEEANEICDEWSTGDVTTLFNSAISACIVQAPVPLSRRSQTDTAEISSSESSSTTASE